MTQNTLPPSAPAAASFTGRKRRVTRKSVKVVDAIAKYVICIGGIGVTFTFAGIVVFIFSVVFPLFRGAKLTALASATLSAPATTTADAVTQTAKPLAMGVDEDLASVWVLDARGDLATYRAAGGQLVKSETLSKQPVTTISNNRGDIAIGHRDGTVKVGRVSQSFEYLDPKALPDTMEAMLPGQTVAFQDGVAAMTASQQVRVVRTTADLSEPLNIGDSPSPIRFVDYLYSDRLEALTAIRDDGRLFFTIITKKENVMTGQVKRSVENHELPVPPANLTKRPAALFIGLNGRLVFLVYEDGKLLRYNTDDPEHAEVMEEVALLPGDGTKVAAVRMLLGNLTLIVSDSKGGVAGWFPAPVERPAGSGDGLHMVKAHVLEPQPGPVTAIGTSARDRQFVTCDALGDLFVRHMTSGTTQGKINLNVTAPVALVAMSPKNDAVAAVDEARRLTLLKLDNPHPDGSMAQLFRPIWYEGYAKPEYVYQSSAGTDDAEAKFSLVPLIFGTIKATVYALLFGIPIAIMAAIYTSEFMEPKVRALVKPTVEMMASLPSVVLGFVAALVLAPMIENAVVAVLAAFIAIPLGVVAFGFVWQLLPAWFTRPVPGWARFGILGLLVVVALWFAFAIGPVVEWGFFHSDFKGWLAGRVGTATPGWTLLLTPLCLVGAALAFNWWVKPRLAVYRLETSPLKLGVLEFARALILVLVAAGAAMLLGWCLSAAGWDLRGSVVGGYVQRNTLIVGMIMGFAIIPIIYTISEDALFSVPGSLRAAALGAGATPWQTAIRVVLPVAASGIFSACMIGLGRAAGETMIVLMASGRTPIMDINIFNGLSALSANIATELPEAPVNSTHYRVLFMSALVLFVLTFVVNTTAEIIRLRFRRRAYQL